MTGLDIGNAYEFQVRAVSGSGESQIGSQASSTASATTITPPPPLKPTGLTATAGDDSVTLTWTSPGDLTIDKYRYRQTTTTTTDGEGDTVGDFASAPWLLIDPSGSGTIEHEVTGLTVGTLYYFQIQAASPYGDSDPSDDASARPVPVRGEWTFETSIDPNPLKSGSEDGAAVIFTATYTVDAGSHSPTSLSAEIAGTSPNISFNFAAQDSGKVGLGSSLSDFGNVGEVGKTPNHNFDCTSDITGAPATITCTFATKIFAATDATPGVYSGTVTWSSGLRFTAKATTAEHTEFVSASVVDSGPFDLELTVIPGPPDAPTGLMATGGNSRTNLEWDDPTNQNITGYEYQQTTTEPGMVLSWTDPADATISGYQYQTTTTEPSITLSWALGGGGLVLGDTAYYEYRRTTAADDNDPPIPDFTGVEWQRIPGSGIGTASHKVTGIDTTLTHYFEVRPVKLDPADNVYKSLDNVDPLTVDSFTGVAWQDIPDSDATTSSYKVAGIDLRDAHWFEVRPLGTESITLTGTTPSVTLTWTTPDVGSETITKYQYRHSTEGTFEADGPDWTDIPSSDANTKTFTPATAST